MKVAICDDDKVFIDSFIEILKRSEFSYIKVIDCYFGEPSMVEDLIHGDYDVILMDMELSRVKKDRPDGIDVAAALFDAKISAKIIFVTSFVDRFVTQLYFKKTNAAGFLTKPVKPDLLKKNLDIIQDEMISKDEMRLTIRSEGKNWLVPVNEIAYIESQSHFVNIYTTQRVYKTQESMATMEAKLPDSFARCHKGFIVNMDFIQGYSASGLQLVGIQDEKSDLEIPIGRRYSKSFKDKYVGYVADHI